MNGGKRIAIFHAGLGVYEIQIHTFYPKYKSKEIDGLKYEKWQSINYIGTLPNNQEKHCDIYFEVSGSVVEGWRLYDVKITDKLKLIEFENCKMLF